MQSSSGWVGGWSCQFVELAGRELDDAYEVAHSITAQKLLDEDLLERDEPAGMRPSTLKLGDEFTVVHVNTSERGFIKEFEAGVRYCGSDRSGGESKS